MPIFSLPIDVNDKMAEKMITLLEKGEYLVLFDRINSWRRDIDVENTQGRRKS